MAVILAGVRRAQLNDSLDYEPALRATENQGRVIVIIFFIIQETCFLAILYSYPEHTIDMG
tara:strand:- start:910 stop:1092 length:183 start_codon:yes stop_codon:yes gene_type:complete